MQPTILIPGALAFLAGTPPADAPRIGPPVAVCARPPDARAQRSPAAAFDGQQTFLVVWQQGLEYHHGRPSQVLAARVSDQGDLLDTAPIALPAGAGSMERPRVAFAPSTGSGEGVGVFLVVWHDFRNGRDWDVRAARVSPDGKVLDAEGITLAAAEHDQAMPDVAAGPDGFLVVWQDRRNGEHYELYGARVSAEGRPLDPGGAPLRINGVAVTGGRHALVRAGGAWHLTWLDPISQSAGGETFPCYLAKITVKEGAFAVSDRQRLVPGLYNLHEPAFAGGAQRLLYANSGSQRSARPALAAMYDADTGQPLKNPNADTRISASGWNTTWATTVIEPAVPGCIPPLAAGAAADEDLFLVVVRQKPAKDFKDALRILRIGADHRKWDDVKNLPVLDAGTATCSNPAVAGGAAGRFLVLYESDAGPAHHRVIARVVQAK